MVEQGGGRRKDFKLDEEKQNPNRLCQKGRAGVCCFFLSSWPHISDPKCKGHRWSLQIKPLMIFQGFGCGSGGDRARSPFGKFGVGVCARGCV